MAEVQKTTVAGEMTPAFIQFVMMQQQQALLAMGRHPSAPPNAAPKNLTLAKVFIDQLGMIREKTAGNLTAEEAELLEKALGTLRAVYLEVVKGGS